LINHSFVSDGSHICLHRYEQQQRQQKFFFFKICFARWKGRMASTWKHSRTKTPLKMMGTCVSWDSQLLSRGTKLWATKKCDFLRKQERQRQKLVAWIMAGKQKRQFLKKKKRKRYPPPSYHSFLKPSYPRHWCAS
jgi:hypothetical protein